MVLLSLDVLLDELLEPIVLLLQRGELLYDVVALLLYLLDVSK